MSKNQRHVEPSIARVYSENTRGAASISRPPPISLDTRCVHTHTCKHYDNSDPALTLQLSVKMRSRYRTDLDTRLWVVHKRAKICGVPFTCNESIRGVKRSGEDKMLRCGSVITLVKGGRSLYAWVIRFLSFDTINLAHVSTVKVKKRWSSSKFIVSCGFNTHRSLTSCYIT